MPPDQLVDIMMNWTSDDYDKLQSIHWANMDVKNENKYPQTL